MLNTKEKKAAYSGETAGTENNAEVSEKEKYYDACGKFMPFAAAPLIALVLSLLVILIFGLKVSVEFKGGTLLTYSFDGSLDSNSVINVVREEGFGSVNVTKGTSFTTKQETITISFTSNSGLSADRQHAFTAKLNEKFAENNLALINSQDVNPSSGTMFFLKCLVAVFLSFIFLVIYITVRFRKIGGTVAGIFAIFGIFNDVIFVFASFVLFRISIDANFMAVSLTILGYSINNTIVVYDRIRENQDLYKQKITHRELVNMSISQSFTRSLNTTITTVSSLAVISVVAVFFGVSSIVSFAFPMVIGMIAGFFSSMYLTGPLWVWWLQKHPDTKGKSKFKAISA